jgi:hypothetical protein
MTKDMKYTLIAKSGKVQTFYIKATAELYQQIYGGVIITDAAFNKEEACYSD